MSNYRCNDCDCEFDKPDSYEECVGEFWGQPAYETFYICPGCGSPNYDEVDSEE